jgi:hypothetical protein
MQPTPIVARSSAAAAVTSDELFERECNQISTALLCSLLSVCAPCAVPELPLESEFKDLKQLKLSTKFVGREWLFADVQKWLEDGKTKPKCC